MWNSQGLPELEDMKLAVWNESGKETEVGNIRNFSAVLWFLKIRLERVMAYWDHKFVAINQPKFWFVHFLCDRGSMVFILYVYMHIIVIVLYDYTLLCIVYIVAFNLD